MVFTLAILLGASSVALWGGVLYVLGSVWRKSRSEEYELDPEDGCGCVEVWEYLSERRGDSGGLGKTR